MLTKDETPTVNVADVITEMQTKRRPVAKVENKVKRIYVTIDISSDSYSWRLLCLMSMGHLQFL